MDMHFGLPAARSTPRPHHFASLCTFIACVAFYCIVSFPTSSIDSDELQHFRTTSSITFPLVIHGAYRFPTKRLRPCATAFQLFCCHLSAFHPH
jgi:hypothetical protein